MSADFDKNRAKAFMGTMMGIINGGSLALMVSIGHRTGQCITGRSVKVGRALRARVACSHGLRRHRRSDQR